MIDKKRIVIRTGFETSPSLLLIALLLSPSIRAQAPRRVLPSGDLTVKRKLALVIGNANYTTSPLRNPINDIRAVSASLQRLGFEVTQAQDLTLRQMDQATGQFASSLRPGDMAVFFYSGHGVQINQENYLLPVDFRAVSAADVRYGALSAAQVRDRLEESGARLRIMILDACRDNPFRSARGGSGGLSPMSSQAEGTLIAFATADNQTAEDNPGESNGLYTKYLLDALDTKGLSLKEIVARTRDNVYRQSGRKQRPYTYDGIIGDLQLAADDTGGAPVNSCAEGWAIVRESRDAALLTGFANDFPHCEQGKLARLRAAFLQPTALAAANPAPGTSILPDEPRGPRRNPKDGLTYVWVPPGKFQMGCSPSDSECSGNERPVEVTLPKGFWLGEIEVTQQAYKSVTGLTPARTKVGPFPVANVSWQEAQEYCGQIGGRLPTEAEWEWAARGGSSEASYGIANDVSWFGGKVSYPPATHEGKAKAGNRYGLYDMLGNVWEFTGDWYGDRLPGGISPTGYARGTFRVMRGGSVNGTAKNMRVSERYAIGPAVREIDVGFRCVWE